MCVHVCVCLCVQVRVLEEHANVRPFPESKSAPSDEHPDDCRPRKYYFLCITKRSPQVGGCA